MGCFVKAPVNRVTAAHRQATAETSSLVGPVDREACDRGYSNWVRGKRVAVKPIVELVDTGRKAGDVVVRSEPLETQLLRTQLRGRGWLRNKRR